MDSYICSTFTRIPTFLLKAIETCLFDDNVQNAVSDFVIKTATNSTHLHFCYEDRASKLRDDNDGLTEKNPNHES